MAAMTYYVALAFKRSEDVGDIVACDPKEARSAASVPHSRITGEDDRVLRSHRVLADRRSRRSISGYWPSSSEARQGRRMNAPADARCPIMSLDRNRARQTICSCGSHVAVWTSRSWTCSGKPLCRHRHRAAVPCAGLKRRAGHGQSDPRAGSRSSSHPIRDF
jgi:hypothetical protein